MSIPSNSADNNNSVLAMERILVMAEQIGFFFAPYPPLRAAEGVRNHLRIYWDPRMRDALLAHIDAGGASGLAAHVVAGAQLLRESTTDQKKGYYGPPQA
jgi:formate dehydrogenase subunit delta